MSLVLRRIRMNRWRPEMPYPWISANDLPPDPLGDMATSGCKLSVWLIEEDLSNLDDVITAVAASGDYISNFDYILFEESLFEQHHIEITTHEGETPDLQANRFHRDIVKLTAASLVSITHAIYYHYKDMKRIHEKKIVRRIADAIHRQRIDINDLHGDVKEKGIRDFITRNPA